jgi:hypothetical protein
MQLLFLQFLAVPISEHWLILRVESWHPFDDKMASEFIIFASLPQKIKKKRVHFGILF